MQSGTVKAAVRAWTVCKKRDSFTPGEQEQPGPSLLLTVVSSLWEPEFSIPLRGSGYLRMTE